MTRVTVITPSYQQAAYIGATIDSVLSQDHADIEYLIYDGGSTDGTVEILRAIRDPRVRWTSERDAGQPDALNKGLRAATGDLITFINSDDLLLPGALRFAVDYFAAHPGVGFLYGDVQIIDAEGHVTALSRSDAEYDAAQALRGGSTMMQQGSVWRRAVTEQIGVFDDSFQYIFDAEYWLRMTLAGVGMAYVPGVRAAFRIHDASKTGSQWDRFLKEWSRLYDRVFADPALPDELRALRPQAEAYLDYHAAKWRWIQGDRVGARAGLRRALRGDRRGRAGLAALMLIDSYLGTPLTRAAAAVYGRLTGADLFSS